jgi:hypothetical protein
VPLNFGPVRTMCSILLPPSHFFSTPPKKNRSRDASPMMILVGEGVLFFKTWLIQVIGNICAECWGPLLQCYKPTAVMRREQGAQYRITAMETNSLYIKSWSVGRPHPQRQKKHLKKATTKLLDMWPMTCGQFWVEIRDRSPLLLDFPTLFRNEKAVSLLVN